MTKYIAKQVLMGCFLSNKRQHPLQTKTDKMAAKKKQ